MKPSVAVLAGGHSAEREVSLLSGHRVRNALAERGYEAVEVDPASAPLLESLSGHGVCYVALHGKEGEDGTVQRLLDLAGFPYTGTGPFACQMAFDKALSKEALSAAGVRTPPWAVVQAAALRDLSAGAILGKVVERVGLPAVVKPSRAGSSMGLSFVERAGDLPAALMGALSFSDAAIVERKVEGTELTAGFAGRSSQLFPLVEIMPKSGIYDYAARYTSGATEYYVPARVPAEVSAAAEAEAIKALGALELRDVGRADLIVDRDGVPWVLEVNVSPGMTETSLLPMAAQAAGVGFQELCERILTLALER
jgi:D-alanine-D-alanine ligase